MDAIKKKMVAMKMEKENALDRAEQLEQKLRETEEAKAKIEDDYNSLVKKNIQTENDFDNANTQLQDVQAKYEKSEKQIAEDYVIEEEKTLDINTMNDQYHSERDLTDPIQLSQDSVQSYQLSQDSVHSNLSQDFTSELLDCENVNEPDKKVKKKKPGTIKKVKKKKKTESLDEETEDGSERPKKKKKKGKISKRPEPEGGNAQPHILNPMSEFDRVIYSNEPLFSDLEMSDNEHPEVPGRPVRTPRPGGAMIPCLQLGMHSNTMIKFAIIGSEIQNLLRVSLVRVWLFSIEIKYLHEYA